jgi:hypothetical protein
MKLYQIDLKTNKYTRIFDLKTVNKYDSPENNSSNNKEYSHKINIYIKNDKNDKFRNFILMSN